MTALATTSDCLRIISGGGEGEVRVWDVDDGPRPITKLYDALKEHKGIVFLQILNIYVNNFIFHGGGIDIQFMD